MAKTQKKRKYTKKRKAAVTLPLFVVILIIALIVTLYILYTLGYLDRWMKPGTGGDNPGSGSGNGGESIITDDLQIHFLELGNNRSGDCTLIKVGNTEVLVDAGSLRSSADTIGNYLDKYVTDGKIEYVIATHAHEDHISAFVGSKNVKGIFERYECGTIIDFAQANTTSRVYRDYLAARDAEVEAGAVHYTALQCWYEQDGAQKSYKLADDITLNILYQKYYEAKASTENNYSVCFLLTQGNNNYLFTGDLEKSGETSLVESNDLPHCKLFKAGHHGSATASNEVLIDVIQPEIVCVCCCGGYREYQQKEQADEFPSQAFCDRVTKYTKLIYVTTMYSETAEGNFESLNGNIVVSSNGGEVKVTCSGSSEPFTESEWYKTYRQKAA